MYLTVTAASQAAFTAALELITLENIVRRGGTVSIGTPLDIVFNDPHGRHYRVSVPASAELTFWHDGGSSYGQKSRQSTYSKDRCVLIPINHDFQLCYDARSYKTFAFQWLANRPMPQVELAHTV